MNKKLEPKTEIIQFRATIKEREELIRLARGGSISSVIRSKLGFND